MEAKSLSKYLNDADQHIGKEVLLQENDGHCYRVKILSVDQCRNALVRWRSGQEGYISKTQPWLDIEYYD
jgi:hypothetical protein